jgi:hypothetical protein
VRYDELEHHWELADGWCKTAQVILPWNMVKKVLGELHG